MRSYVLKLELSSTSIYYYGTLVLYQVPDAEHIYSKQNCCTLGIFQGRQEIKRVPSYGVEIDHFSRFCFSVFVFDNLRYLICFLQIEKMLGVFIRVESSNYRKHLFYTMAGAELSLFCSLFSCCSLEFFNYFPRVQRQRKCC